jgi:nucleoside-diphosphate-sugar epimerase
LADYSGILPLTYLRCRGKSPDACNEALGTGNMKALVTGASGFIGRHLVERLTAAGDDVRALVRGSSRVGHLQEQGVRLISGDVTERDSLRAATRGVDVVYHLAGCTAARSLHDFMRVNARGAGHVAAACAAQNSPPTMVLVSSLAAAGPARHGRPRVETDRPSPVSHYGLSKLAGERAAAAWSARVPLSIVRPPIVFGPWDRTSLLLFRMVSRLGAIITPGFRHSPISWIHAADVAEALVQVAHRGQRIAAANGAAGRYYLAAEEHPCLARFGQTISQSLGRRGSLVLHLPHLLCWAAGVATELICQARRRAATLGLDKTREVTAGSWTCDPSAVRRELGFSPARTLEQRVRETADWYRQQNWL